MCGLQVKMQNVQTRGNANEGIKVGKMKTKVHRQFLKSFLAGRKNNPIELHIPEQFSFKHNELIFFF